MKNHHPKQGKKNLPTKKNFDQLDGNISLEELAKLSLEPKETREIKEIKEPTVAPVPPPISKTVSKPTKEPSPARPQPTEKDIALQLFQGKTPIPEGVYQPNPSNAPQKTSNQKASTPASSSNTTAKNNISSVSKTDTGVQMRLDDFLQEEQANKATIIAGQLAMEKLQQEIITIQASHTQEMTTMQDRHKSLKFSIAEQEKTIANLQEQLDKTQAIIENMHDQLALMEERNQQLGKELERKNREPQHVVHTPRSEFSASIATLLQQNGLVSLEEKQQFFAQLQQQSVLFTAFQHMTLGSVELASMLQKNIWLVGEHIFAHHHISGVCISVAKERCVISKGIDIIWFAREITTEILLRGWRQLLILGIPLELRSTLYSWLASSSLEVQIDEWQTHVDAQCVLQARDVDVVLVHNLDNICVPEHTSIPVYRYSHANIGEMLESFYKQIREE